MASILQFPSSFFTKSPIPKPSPSAAEIAPNCPRPGPHLVIQNARQAPLLVSTDERWMAVGVIDLDTPHGPNRSRLRRLFSPSDSPDTWPHSAA